MKVYLVSYPTPKLLFLQFQENVEATWTTNAWLWISKTPSHLIHLIQIVICYEI